MMNEEGRLYVTPEELAAFMEPAQEYIDGAIGPVVPHLWMIDPKTGRTEVRRGAEAARVPEDMLLLMTGPDTAWLNQWRGKLQKACDEQLNPMLARYSG